MWSVWWEIAPVVLLLVVVGVVVVRRLAKKEHRRRQQAMNTQDLRQLGAFSAAPRPLNYLEQMSLERHRKRLAEKEQMYVVDAKNRKVELKQRSLEREERINQIYGKQRS
jgi:hypothetical protein